MSKSALWVGGLLLVIMIAGMWVSGNYNSLVTARGQVKFALSTLDSTYQKRFDIIDNLVESVKSAQKQESSIFIAIANSRKMYKDASAAGDVEGQAAAVTGMETNIALLPRLQEAQYPDLKTIALVSTFMGDLRTTEVDVKDARDNFSKVATNYNINIARFPKNFFAKYYGFNEIPVFKAEVEASKAVKVKF